MTEQEKYWVWLTSIEGLGPVRFYNILGAFIDIETAFKYAKDIPKKVSLPKKTAEKIVSCANEKYLNEVVSFVEKSDVFVLTRLSNNYPNLLAEIENPPPVLYGRGIMPQKEGMFCGMVGTRNPTKSGYNVAFRLAEQLATEGVCVVSGMARGIDTACHRGALAAGGKTIAVLGSGVDICYPPENEGLYEEIAKKGTLLSEFLPGTLPAQHNFPQRNRILSGLSHVLVAGEGGERSGARITVDYALKHGRDVYTMRTDLKSPVAKLPLYLLESGAPVVSCASEIIRDMGFNGSTGVSETKDDENFERGTLNKEEMLIVLELEKEELSADELAEKIGIPIKDLNMLLTVLELKGIINAAPGGVFQVYK